MYGRTWKLNGNKSKEIRDYLLRKGGIEESPTNPYELWRLKLKGSTFVYYTSGKLYSTQSEEAEEIWKEIDLLVEDNFDLSKDYVLGFDEVGKGEVFGPIITCGVLIKRDYISQIPSELKTPDTKKSHDFEYWTRILSIINRYISDVFFYAIDLIQPREIDCFNINQLLDLSYTKLIKRLMEGLPLGVEARVVIDDYGVGEGLKKFLEKESKESNFEYIFAIDSEDKFLEVKLASLIAKAHRERILKFLQETYGIPRNLIKGNMSNKKLELFLVNYSHIDSWFIRKSFGNKVKKEKPSFYNLISEEGKFRCFFCGKENNEAFLRNYKFVCPFCDKEMKDLDLAMKYHSGVIKVDKESFEPILEVIKNSHLLDGFGFVFDHALKGYFIYYENIGRILTLDKPPSKYITSRVKGDVVVFSLFRNVDNI